jgi:hypothetical protein
MSSGSSRGSTVLDEPVPVKASEYSDCVGERYRLDTKACMHKCAPNPHQSTSDIHRENIPNVATLLAVSAFQTYRNSGIVAHLHQHPANFGVAV